MTDDEEQKGPNQRDLMDASLCEPMMDAEARVRGRKIKNEEPSPLLNDTDPPPGTKLGRHPAVQQWRERTFGKKAAPWKPDERYGPSPEDKRGVETTMSTALTAYPGDEFGPVKRLLEEKEQDDEDEPKRER